MKKMKYGLIGSGMMGREHIANIALLENTQLVAIADPVQSSLDETTAKSLKYWPEKPTQYKTHKEMLKHEQLDAVVIASPNFTHFGILEDICNDYPNLPVLAEKPICTTLEDCHKLLALYKKHKAPFWVAMEYRFIPAVAKLINEVHQKKIGNLKMLAIREHRFPFLKKVGDWNRFNRFTGGTLVEKCCHFFDLMRLITQDEAVRVYASGDINVNHLDERYNGETPDILDNAYVIVDFKSGKRALLDICMFAEGSYYQEEISVVGDTAKIETHIPSVQRFWPGALENPESAPKPKVTFSPRNPKGPTIEVIKADQSIIDAGDHQGSTYYQHQKFLAAILGTGKVEVNLEDGIKAVMIGLAAEQSAKEKRPIDINY